MLLLEILLPHVDHADQRELAVIDSGGQTKRADISLSWRSGSSPERGLRFREELRIDRSGLARRPGRVRDTVALPPVCRKSRALRRPRSIRDAEPEQTRRFARQSRLALCRC